MGSDERANQRNAVLAGFLGWTFDAFDFFVLVFVLSDVAKEFGRTIPALALTLAATLAMRPVGALVFGLLADRYGRRLPLIANILFYSIVEVASGFAPSYNVFFVLRLLYGIGMGGEWGVGASLVMESVPARWRGLLSGLLQMGYVVGYLAAAFVYYVVFPYWGWRALFIVGGAPALLTLFIRAKVKDPEVWRESRTDWVTYRRAMVHNWRIFAYLVVFMTMMNFIAHGTQDLYPTYLKQYRHYSSSTTAVVTMISMFGAMCGGLAFGLLSDKWGRRRMMITGLLLAAASIPFWVFAPNMPLVVAGAFLMQFMVQGAWGIVPAHINELAPDQLRGFFPGVAYQLGVLFASTIGYFEAVLGENFNYAMSMGLLAAIVLLTGAVVVQLGPEAKGVVFGREPAVSVTVST